MLIGVDLKFRVPYHFTHLMELMRNLSELRSLFFLKNSNKVTDILLVMFSVLKSGDLFF